MPDLRRERRDRERQRLDILVTVTADLGGDRNDFGEFVPTVETFTTWARRDDLDAEETRSLEEAGQRFGRAFAYVMRHDDRIAPGKTTITDPNFDGAGHVDRVEHVGRRRYLRAITVYST